MLKRALFLKPTPAIDLLALLAGFSTRQPHGIREPKLQLQAMRANLEWFNQHLK